MKSLKFKLISNKEVVIEEEVNYFLKDNIIKFKIKDTLYEFCYINDILIKKDKESSITIDIPKNNIIINLFENNLFFDMEITVEKYKKTDKSVIIEYTFISDEKTTNCIFIDY